MLDLMTSTCVHDGGPSGCWNADPWPSQFSRKQGRSSVPPATRALRRKWFLWLEKVLITNAESAA